MTFVALAGLALAGGVLATLRAVSARPPRRQAAADRETLAGEPA